MYRELFGKKFTSTIAPSVEELTFASQTFPALPPAAIGALVGINRHTPVSIEEVDSGGDWFRLESDDLEDEQLFHGLKTSWPSIIGSNTLSFALIHCKVGPDSGVWLHRLSPFRSDSEFRPGCHQLTSWS